MSGTQKFTERMAIACKPHLTNVEFVRLANDSHPKIRMKIAKRPDTPSTILSTFADEADLGIRIAVAQHKSVSTDTLSSLSCDTSINLIAAVARSHNIAPHTLTQLSRHTDIRVLQAVAKNCNVPFSILDALANHENEKVRIAVAKNKKTPRHILLRLAKSNDSESVQNALLKKGYYFESLYLQLSKSPFKYIRQLAYGTLIKSKHFNSKRELIEEMSKDEYVYTRSAAATSKYVSEVTLLRLTRDKDSSVRWQAGRNPVLSEKILKHLSNDVNHSVRSSVAKNPSTSPELLTRLSFDESDFVRREVAANEKTPQEVLKKFIMDPSSFVRINVIENKSLSAAWLKKNFPNQFLSEHATRMLASRGGSITEIARAMNPETSIHELEALSDWCCELDALRDEIGDNYEKYDWNTQALKRAAHSKEMVMLSYLVGNPSLPLETLNKICDRVSAEVRSQSGSSATNVLFSIIQSPACTRPILDKIMALSETDDQLGMSDKLKMSIASKSITSSAMLANFATHSSEKIRAIVAINPSTPIESLIVLASDISFKVRFRLIQRTNIPDEVGEVFLADVVMSEIYQERLDGGYYPSNWD